MSCIHHVPIVYYLLVNLVLAAHCRCAYDFYCSYIRVFFIMPDLVYVVSERNEKKLVDGGFLFVKDRVVGEVTQWKCDQYKKKHTRPKE